MDGKMVTLYNDFHNTTARVRVGANGMLSPNQVKNAQNRLCGIGGCQCSNDLGQRGPQEARFDCYREYNGKVAAKLIY